jgi:hypothetical protein
VQTWLARNPRNTIHFTPTAGSWPKCGRDFFGIITRHGIRRGTLTRVKDLTSAIRRFIGGNPRPPAPATRTRCAVAISPGRHLAGHASGGDGTTRI